MLNSARQSFLVRLISLLFFILCFVVAFFKEWEDIFGWRYSEIPPKPEEIIHSYNILVVNLRWFGWLALAWLLIVSAQVFFPIDRAREWLLTAFYFLMHIFGLHGMAACVRNGEIAAEPDELKRQRPGAIMVDFNSALVLEQQVVNVLPRLAALILRGIARVFGAHLPAVRVRGAGLTFTLPDERIHGANDLTHDPGSDDPNWVERIVGVVDLRPQFRSSSLKPHKQSKRLGTTISAYTRDGVEVKTDISVVATIGQKAVPHFPVSVIYNGEQHPRNIRVISFKRVSPRTDLYRVQSIEDSLDPVDQLEIHQQFQTLTNWVAYKAPPDHPRLPDFNPERVFSAAFARARHHMGLQSTDEIVPWVELPVHVAIDFFREWISRFNYDELYQPDGDGKLPVNWIRNRLATQMRNSGVLSYRPVKHVDGRCLKPGEKYRAASLQTIPPLNAIMLHQSKILRDRGIRVITAGFGSLSVDNNIYRQRFDHWRAYWDQETILKEAGYDYRIQVTQARTRARVLAEQEFSQILSEIYRANANSKEILTFRVLQALEEAATNPKTRELLPEDTFSVLRSLHDWVLPGDGGNPAAPQ